MSNQDKWEKSYKLIIDTLKNNELGDAYLILQGLNLVSYEHIDFWFQVVEVVRKHQGIEKLVAYIDAMQQLGRSELMVFIRELKIRFNNFQDMYKAYIELLSETNRINEENVIKK